MISTTALRNAFWCALALLIVAGTSAPTSLDKYALARAPLVRGPETSQFAEIGLHAAPSRLVAAQAAEDKRDADAAARLADRADAEAQLAEAVRADGRANDIVVSQGHGAAPARAGGLR